MFAARSVSTWSIKIVGKSKSRNAIDGNLHTSWGMYSFSTTSSNENSDSSSLFILLCFDSIIELSAVTKQNLLHDTTYQSCKIKFDRFWQEKMKTYRQCTTDACISLNTKKVLYGDKWSRSTYDIFCTFI
jgi:hypothetical protein